MEFIRLLNVSPISRKILLTLFDNGASIDDANKVLAELEEATKEIISTLSERELAKKRADERANENEPASNCKKYCPAGHIEEETNYRLKWIYKDILLKYYTERDRINRIATLAKVSLFISILAFITAVAS